jgi:peptidylprolyl isomerase
MPHTAVKIRKPNTSGVADEGTLVTIHYTGTLDSGETFDSSEGREPIEFVIGEHAVIKGFEDSVTGMKKGEKKHITIEAADAYGDINPQLRQEVPKQALGEIAPEVGMMLALQHPMAPQPIPVKVVEVGEQNITIDLNHPLAGQRLHFDIELVDLK